MPHNGHTKATRKIEQRRRAKQEKELRKIARALKNGDATPVTSPVDSEKERRRAQYEKKQNHKASVIKSIITSLLVIALAACGVGSPRGELAHDQQILASCDRSALPASLIEIDGTGSSASGQILAERMTAIEPDVRRTAICGGRERIQVFSSSSASTEILFDGPLQPDGATDNARLKRVPKLVESVMAKVKTSYGPAVAKLDQGGSDITAQYRLASEWIAQVGRPTQLHLTILSDGFQNIGVDLDARPLSKAEAIALASQVNMPKLTGATVVVAGLGKVAGTPPRSDVVEGLVAYYDTLCHRSGAASCLSVTDYADAVGR